MKHEAQTPSLLTLITLTALASMTAVLFTPGLPMIQDVFHVDTGTLQLSVSMFVVGYAVSQLIYAPLANTVGRKNTIYIGLLIATISSLVCVVASPAKSFLLFVIARFFMAIGSGVGLSLSFTIVNDVYESERARKVVAYMTLAFAILPGIGVFIGGLLIKFFNWQSCFYFTALWFVFTAWLTYRLPETSTTLNKSAIKPMNILRNYLAVAKLNLLGYAFLWGLSTTIIYLFSGIAPLIAIKTIGATPAVYGQFNLLTSAGLIIGNIISANCTEKLSARAVVFIGILIAVSCSVLLTFIASISHFTLWSFFLPVFFLYIGLPMILSNCAVLASRQAKDKASAASCVGFVNMGTAVIGMLVVGTLHSMPEHYLPSTFLILSVLALVVYLLLGKQTSASS